MNIANNERLNNIEVKVSKLYSRVELILSDKKELIDKILELEQRILELETNYNSSLLKICNCDKSEETICESKLHHCSCHKLKNKTYNCLLNFDDINHKCICQYEVKNGIEVIKSVGWCLAHNNTKDPLFDINLTVIPDEVKPNYNTSSIMQFLYQLNK